MLPSYNTALRIGTAALRVNPLRTSLSTLGVIIGVAALVAVLSLGDGMERTARERIGATSDLQSMVVASRTVENMDGDFFPLADTVALTEAEVQAIAALPGAELTRVALEGRSEVRIPDAGVRRMASVRALRGGAVPEAPIVHGRGLTAADDSAVATNAVISHLLARRLSPNPASIPSLIGQPLIVLGGTLRIVGVLARQSTEMIPAVHLPYATAQALLLQATGKALPTLIVRARSIEDVGPTKDGIEGILGRRTPQWKRQFEVATYEARASQVAQGILIFKLLMGAITGISLLVGGIGIMNVLLASVSERTREIGIRRATGATRRDILLQFLSESVAISGFGSLVGIILGLVGAFGITAAIRQFSSAGFVRASFSWSSVLAAAAASLLIGLLFGMYPARRAAWLSPIDAIRHE
jgi:putative ABC transport system permease protein